MFFSCISFGLEQVCNSQKHEEFIECLKGLSMSFLTLFPSFAYLFDFQTLEEKHEIFFSSAGFFFIMCYFFLVIRFSKNWCDAFNFTGSALVFNLSIFHFANILVQFKWVSPWSLTTFTQNNIPPLWLHSPIKPAVQWQYALIICPPGKYSHAKYQYAFPCLYPECSRFIKSICDFALKYVAISWL